MLLFIFSNTDMTHAVSDVPFLYIYKYYINNNYIKYVISENNNQY